MKKILLFSFLCLMSLIMCAQTSNIISIPDIKASLGDVQLPVNISNTDEIVAVQFDLTLPAGVMAGTNVALTNRSDGHVAVARNMGSGKYRVMLYAQPTTPLLGQSGTVMNIPINIPNSYEEGAELKVEICDAILSKSTGENVLTTAEAGTITISKLPDLTVKNIAIDKTTLIPCEHIVVSWLVENIGGIATNDGWSEQISLVNADRTFTKLIATNYFDGTLAAGALISQQLEIALPKLIGLDGEAYIQIRIVPNSQTGESASSQGNNTLTADTKLNIEKRLFVEVEPVRVIENKANWVMIKVSRSGNWSCEQTFTLSANDDSRITLPAQITIPKGQSSASVYMTITDNDVLDDSEIVTITATGNDYADATCMMAIEDNEYPDLTLTTSKSVVTEGETFQLTVTTSRVSTQPIEVTITSENIKRFSLPQTVTIPAGEISATIEVTAIDDEIPSLELSNAFTASAPKHNKSEIIVLLKDNDLPVLELTLTPTTVQESAGVVAVAGVLHRTTNTNSKITVKLTDDADGGLYFGNRTLVLDKGVEEVHFNFGPVDNAIVEGDRIYTVTAAVWLSSCSCNATGESAGYVEAQLQVLDNDGPALNVTSSLSTVKEGGKTTLTLSRNTTDTSAALTVTVNSDYEDGLTYDHTVTILAGEQSTTVEVISAANSVQGDSHTVIFTIEAEGYAKGTCFVMVTDQTLPDARLNSITASLTEAEVGSKVKLTIEVANEGAAELPAEVAVKVYRRGDSNAVGTIYTSEAIAVGASTTVVKTITLPNTVGNHSYYAVVNAENVIQELTYNNNTTEDVIIKTTAPFSVTVSTDKSIYQQGDEIIITGQLTGNNTANTDVDIYLINEGARQVQTVKTDALGAFSYEWQLYTLQSGHFIVGACYPDEGLKAEMAAFDVYGLRRTEYSNITCDVICGDTYKGSLRLINPGNLDLTGVNVEMLSVPETCEAQLTMPATIGGGEYVQLSYQLKGLTPTLENKWEEIKARVKTDEGVALDVTLYFYCRNAQGKLVASTQDIVTTMTKGKAREYSIQVTNIGHGNTGKISLSLPNFIKSLAGNTLPSINQNDTLIIPLSFVTTEDMQLNVPVTGRIGINCENGDGTPVCFNITPVSSETGKLVVDVCDEYTYYTNEAPHVEGAEVVLRNPVTGALVTQGRTGADGLFSVVLPEGYYKLSVIANKHDSYTNNIFIDPGIDNTQVINLSIQAVSISWDVEETEVEDEYEIVTTVKFETNVPEPVVIISAPSKIDYESMADGESIIFNVLLTNKGLITAENVQLRLPEPGDDWVMTPLADVGPFTIAPQTTITVPVSFTRLAINPSRMRRAPDNHFTRCMAGMAAYYEWLCGRDWKNNEAAFRMAVKACTISAISEAIASTIAGWFGGSGGPGGPSGSGGGTYDNDWSDNGVDVGTAGICNPEIASAGERAINNALGCIPLIGPILSMANSGADAAYDIARDGHVSPGTLGNIGLAATLPFLPIAGRMIGGGGSAIGAGNYGSEMGALIGENVGRIAQTGTNVLMAIGSMINFSNEMSNNSRVLNAKRSKSSSISWLDDYYTNAEKICYVLQDFINIQKEYFGNSVWYIDYDDTIEDFFRKLQSLPTESYTISVLKEYQPESITDKDFELFIERLVNTLESKESDNKMNIQAILEYANNISLAEEKAIEEGYESVLDMYNHFTEVFQEEISEESNSLCASIVLQIKQTMVMTRQAFRGTLTVFNGHETIAMTDMKLKLNVSSRTTDVVATSHEFQINAESLDGFTGELDLGSGWTLGANKTGTATVLFIPTKYAAPEKPTEWSFGGTLSYIDPFTGLEVTRELYPVTLTVKPSPELDLTYFMQRDVYGDDALTLDVVEPMKPAEFALLINNKGNGDATNVRMVTQQPEIIDNEKGLNIDFELISSQVNGGEAALSFGQSIANDFGNIPAHSQMYAQWWLTSTLLGHFIDYKVEASHVTSYGNEDLSLLGQVTIHELIHGFDMPSGSLAGGPEIGRAFLVNDITDANDLPDKLYFTNGETANVDIATTATVERTSPTTCILTISPSATGWNYGSVLDPTYGYAELKSIVRQSDGLELGNTRFWQTDRTLRDGKDWLYENRLHFVDDFASGGSQTYVLTFDPVPETVLTVQSIGIVPTEGEIAEAPIDELTVAFNKVIDASTFTSEDITFIVQGVKQDANQIGISTEDNKLFKLNMSGMNETLPNGYYTLTVQTADITDSEGFKGKDGKQTSWILFRGGLVQLLTSAWPENAGTVLHKPQAYEAPFRRAATDENSATYGSTVTFEAEPAEGYEFSNWTLNGEVVSTNAEFTTTALNDMTVVANFTKKKYKVEIAEGTEGGSINGFATGIYEHGTKMTLTAMPQEDYIFKGWTVNGIPLDNHSNVITLTAIEAMKVNATFEREYYRHTMTLVRGWNWVSSFISEAWPMEQMSTYANRILGQFDELIRDPQYGMVGGLAELTAGVAYKVEALQYFTTSFRGHLLALPIAMKKGWNWVAYPWMDSRLVSQAIPDAEEGDYLVSQRGFTEYADGYWEGSLNTLIPGEGYMYKSMSDKNLVFNFLSGESSNRAMAAAADAGQMTGVDIHSYPNTMNMTIQVYKDESNLSTDALNIYAFAGNELRGISQQIGNNHYLTVYGEDPVEISFAVEAAATGENYAAAEVLTFRNDVVGSRKSPFILHLDNATGIYSLVDGDRPMTVYSLEGILISCDATLKTLKKLPKGVYIVNGQKCFVK